jgi:DNA-binding NtrC family response regulator
VADHQTHTTVVRRQGQVAQVKRKLYRVTAGRGKAAISRRCSEDTITLGSHEGNTIVLNHPTVSRFHARLELDPLGFQLTDLDSTNGTFVGGMRVKQVYLEPRAKILLGDEELQFEVDREEVELGLAEGDRLGGLWGGSAVMRRLFDEIVRVAPSDATILLQGETGSGKDLVAQEIHRHSRRANGPLVVVDCAGLPDTLIEAELFGHERGAFTGAVQPRAGAFEEADGGTLFLDEVAELPIELQAKLLRALEARRVKRLGANDWRAVDVRVIAATHQDLARLCNQRLFREDLYFRLAVVTMRIPSLRDRLEDLPLLVSAILEESGASQSFQLDEPLLEALRARRWAGNVRELRNVIHRAVVLGPNSLTAAAEGEGGEAREEPFKVAKARAIEEFEKRYLVGLLERLKGNVARAAREAEVDPAWIFRLVKRHGIDLATMRRR